MGAFFAFFRIPIGRSGGVPRGCWGGAQRGARGAGPGGSGGGSVEGFFGRPVRSRISASGFPMSILRYLWLGGPAKAGHGRGLALGGTAKPEGLYSTILQWHHALSIQ